MIKKFIELNTIGKFQAYKANGDVELRKLNLIFAENGRGKTTLCDILRSLRTNTGDYIIGRKALNLGTQPEAHIRLDGTTTQFRNGAWTVPYPDIEIFDSYFVHENVYSGDHVSHDHKKNLYQFVVGDEGVTLARKIDDLDNAIRTKNDELSRLKTVVVRLVPSGLGTAEQFIAIQPDSDIEAKIEAQKQTVTELESASAIKARALFGRLTLIEIPPELVVMLRKTIDTVSADAETRVNEHLKHGTNGTTSRWLAEGIDTTKADGCPFCGVSIADNELVKAYQAVFNAEYRGFKEQVAKLESTVQRTFNSSALLAVQVPLITNKAAAEFWTNFIDLGNLSFPDEKEVVAALDALREIILTYVRRKIQAPLEAVELDHDWDNAMEAFDSLKATFAESNAALEKANARITEKKKAIATGNLADAKRTLARLELTKARFQPLQNSACAAYQTCDKEKAQMDADKAGLKIKLDEYAESTFSKYQGRINKLLEMFNAGFQIVNIGRSYAGGKVSSTYQISINNVAVDLGDSSTPINRPSFRNTLSSGDKTTLGLAFFIAQLQERPDLTQKVVVFDDPFTSQDRFRRTTTQQLICKLTGSARQVIVLSHDPNFLKSIWDASLKPDLKTLQLARVGTETVINEWDIEAETRPGYIQDYGALQLYVREGQGERRDVARKIRPLLEGNLRMKFPGKFQENEWLGDFIVRIRNAEQTDVLHNAQSILEEVEAINEYSKHYHHQQNPNADTHPIDGGELQGYAKRTLAVVGGY